MKNKLKQLKLSITTSMCLLILSGCQHIPNQPAKQTLLNATNMQLESNGYNMTMVEKIRVYPTKTGQHKTKASNNKMLGTGDKLKKLLNLTPKRTQALDTYVFKPYTKTLTYAIDKKNKKAQVDYHFLYKPKNLELAFKLPMLFDFSDMSITLDPSMLLPVLGVVYSKEVGTKWDNKLVKFTLPKEHYKDLPIDLLVRALEKTLLNSVEKMPEQSFIYQKQARANSPSLKQMDASYAMVINVSTKEQVDLFEGGVKRWINNIKEEVEKSPNKVKNPEELYAMLEKVDAFFQKIITGSSKQHETGMPALKDILKDTKVQYYFDGKNRVVGHHANLTSDAFSDSLNMDIGVTQQSKIYNYGSPVFTLKPTPEKTINGNELFEKDQVDDFIKGFLESMESL